MITYRNTNQLTDAEIHKVEALTEIIHQYDHTAHWLFLSNQFNLNQAMPCFYIAEEQGKIVGFGLLANESKEEGELSVIVHPTYRRQGIAHYLLSQMDQTCLDYQIVKKIYKTERAFMNAHSDWIAKFYLAGDSVPEYVMEMVDVKKVSHVQKSIQIQEANENNIEQLARGLAEAFDEPYEDELRFVKLTLANPTVTQYLFLDEKENIVGACAVDWGRKVNYIFAVMIFEHYQNRGYAKMALSKVMQSIREKSDLPIQLQVERDNEPAKKVYQAVGLKVVSEVVDLVTR